MNVDRAYPSSGPCADLEFELVEYVDDACAPERRAALQRHLESCGRCRAFVQRIAGITESLALALPHVELSPHFDTKLQARIAGLERSSRRDAARAAAEQEYRGALASLRQGLRWRVTLNAIASASVGAGLVAAAASLVPRLQQALDVAHVAPATLSLGIGAVGLLAGLLAAVALGRQPWQSTAG